MLSFHFPQKGSSAAQSVPARRHTNPSEKQNRFMVVPPAQDYSPEIGKRKGECFMEFRQAKLREINGQSRNTTPWLRGWVWGPMDG
jgi:hypothetical protein